jgi:hypothetical protein
MRRRSPKDRIPGSRRREGRTDHEVFLGADQGRWSAATATERSSRWHAERMLVPLPRMRKEEPMAVLGVDACRGGWVAVGLAGSGVSAHTAASIGEVMEVAGPAEVVAIDIPIGLPATGRRRADCIARSLLGPRRSSVFFAPPRDVLVAPGHREAADRCEKLCGYRVSQQAYRLGPKILEVASWLADYPGPVIEVLPRFRSQSWPAHRWVTPRPPGQASNNAARSSLSMGSTSTAISDSPVARSHPMMWSTRPPPRGQPTDTVAASPNRTPTRQSSSLTGSRLRSGPDPR